jgi:hypothetical protein
MVPLEIEQLAVDHETAIVLTAPWHERDAQSLVEPLGVPVYTPSLDTAEDLLRTYDFTAPEGWISPDVRWLLAGEAGQAHWYSAGDRLPVGLQAFPGQKRNDMVLWIESHRAVVAGDTLADLGEGPQINPRWLRGGVTREQVVDGLRPLLALPVEHLLETHAAPSTGAPSSARSPEAPPSPQARTALLATLVTREFITAIPFRTAAS